MCLSDGSIQIMPFPWPQGRQTSSFAFQWNSHGFGVFLFPSLYDLNLTIMTPRTTHNGANAGSMAEHDLSFFFFFLFLSTTEIRIYDRKGIRNFMVFVASASGVLSSYAALLYAIPIDTWFRYTICYSLSPYLALAFDSTSDGTWARFMRCDARPKYDVCTAHEAENKTQSAWI